MVAINETMEKVIHETVKRTAEELKNKGLLKEGSIAYKKTEQVLYSYMDLKLTIDSQEGIEPANSDYLEIIEKSLLKIKEDPYFKIIVYKYFEGRTINEIAGIMNIENSVVTRNKNRLINRLKIFLYPKDAIIEMLD